jgi:hypothetical protein
MRKASTTINLDFNIGRFTFAGNRGGAFFRFNKHLRSIVSSAVAADLDSFTEISSFSRASLNTPSEVYPHESISVVSSKAYRQPQVAVPPPTTPSLSSKHIAPSSQSSSRSKNRSKSESSMNMTVSSTRQELALRSAMSRHMSELEARASEAMKARKRWEEQIQSVNTLASLESEKRKNLEMENAKYLINQMKENEGRRHRERECRVVESSSHNFPLFTEPPSIEHDEYTKNRCERIRKELDMQVQTQKASRNISAIKDRELVNRMNELNKRALEQQSTEERDKRKNEKSILQESWNRDIRFKNCWKAIENFDMVPDTNVGVLLPTIADDSDSQSVILGGSSSRRRSFTGSIRKL